MPETRTQTRPVAAALAIAAAVAIHAGAELGRRREREVVLGAAVAASGQLSGARRFPGRRSVVGDAIPCRVGVAGECGRCPERVAIPAEEVEPGPLVGRACGRGNAGDRRWGRPGLGAGLRIGRRRR